MTNTFSCLKCPAACSKCIDDTTCTECKEFSDVDPDNGCPCSTGTAASCAGECKPVTIDSRCHWSQYWKDTATTNTDSTATTATAANGICEQCHDLCGSCLAEGED